MPRPRFRPFVPLAACLLAAASLPAAAKGGAICLDLDPPPGPAARQFASDIGHVELHTAAGDDARLVALRVLTGAPVYRVTAVLAGPPGTGGARPTQRVVASSPHGVTTLELQGGEWQPEAVCIER